LGFGLRNRQYSYLSGVCDLLDVAATAGLADGGQWRHPILAGTAEFGQFVYQLLAGHFFTTNLLAQCIVTGITLWLSAGLTAR